MRRWRAGVEVEGGGGSVRVNRCFPLASITLPGACSFFFNVTPVHCGMQSFSWGGGSVLQAVGVVEGGVALTTLFRFPLAPSAMYACTPTPPPPHHPPPPPPVCLSARRRTFWFWTEGLSCRSEARASHWRSWAFSWADSARRLRVERAPCTWPLGRERWDRVTLFQRVKTCSWHKMDIGAADKLLFVNRVRP